jgi:NAD(P)-dependent dehydrogenase (short-subunit alcohol dehydrogenase family)
VTRFDGQVAVVTGATGGLGPAVVEAFRERGATVFATTRAEAAAEAGGVVQVRVDLTSEVDVLALADRVRAEAGRCDALLCCAGGFAPGRPSDSSLENWHRQLELNATTAFLSVRAFLPLMLEAGRGAIVLVSSRSAVEPSPGAVGYAAGKGAVLALAAAAAAEGRERGVRTNTVLPSIIDTPANRSAMPDADHDRWVAPSSIAGVMAWLCSDEAADVSGTVLPVYGRA